MIPGVFPKRTDPVTEEFKRLGVLPGDKPKELPSPAAGVFAPYVAERPQFVSLGKAKRIALEGLEPEQADVVASYLFANQKRLAGGPTGSPMLTDVRISPIEGKEDAGSVFAVPTAALDRAVVLAKSPGGIAKMREFVDVFRGKRERQGGSVRTGRAVAEALTAGPTKEETRLQGLANTLPFEMGAYQRAVGDGSSVVPVKPEWKAHYPEGFVPLTTALKMLDNKGLSRAGMTTEEAEAKQVEEAGKNVNRGFGPGARSEAHLTPEERSLRHEEALKNDVSGLLSSGLEPLLSVLDYLPENFTGIGGAYTGKAASETLSSDLIAPIAVSAMLIADDEVSPERRALAVVETALNVLPIEAGVIVTKGAKRLLGDASWLTRELGKKGIEDAPKVAERIAEAVRDVPEPELEEAMDRAASAIFASPNIAEGATAEQAVKAIRGSRHANIKAQFKDVLNEHGGDAEIRSGIGDWKDGAEDTIVVTTKSKPYSETRAMAAKMGLKADQKAVIPFSVEEGGPDSLYRLYFPKERFDEATVRASLESHGIKFRTILTGSGKDIEVAVFDPGGSLEPNVSQLLEKEGINGTILEGRGEFLGEPSQGDPTRAGARRIYRQVIDDWSAGQGRPGSGRTPVPDDADGRGGVKPGSTSLQESGPVDPGSPERTSLRREAEASGGSYRRTSSEPSSQTAPSAEQASPSTPFEPDTKQPERRYRRGTAQEKQVQEPSVSPERYRRSQTGRTQEVSPEEASTRSAPTEGSQARLSQDQSITGTGPKHADIDELRRNYGLSERTERYKSDESLRAEAKALEPEAVNIARASTAAKRIMSDKEQVAVAGGIESRRSQFNALRRQFDEAAAKGDEVSKVDAQVRMDAIAAEMQDMARALDESGSEGAAAQRARRFVAEAVEGGYSEPDIAYRFTKATGKAPDRVERRTIGDHAAKIADLEDKLAKAEQKAATDRRFIEELRQGLRAAPSKSRAANKLFTQKSYEDAVKRLKTSGVKGRRSGATTIPSDIVDLSIIAGYHIESGLRSLPDIYDAVRAALPDATDADINLATKHALDQIDAKPKRVAKAVERTIKDLTQEVDAAVKGKTNVTDLESARRRISEIEEIIKDPTKGLDELEAAWSDLTELRRKYAQGSSYGFDVLVQGKYGTQVEDVAELRYLLDRAKRDTQKYVEDARKRAEYESLNGFSKVAWRAGQVAKEIKNFPSQAISSLDMSYTGRQGIWFSLNPRYANATKEMFNAQVQALKSQEGYQRAAHAIRNNKNFDRLRRNGLIIEGEEFGAANAEQFESAILGKIAPYKATGRAYEMAGNMQRIQIADDILTGMEKFGGPLDDDGIKVLTDYVNAATGRGTSKLSKSLQALQVLWAPRLVGGRLEVLSGSKLIKAAMYGAKTGDFRLARRIAEDYAAFGGMIAAVLGAAQIGGAKVEWTDSSSPDWLKVKVGDLHIDPLGGFQQVGRFILRMYGAMMDSARSESKWGNSPSDIAERFFRSKLNPLVGETANWLVYDKKNYVGEDVTPLGSAASVALPLGMRELYSDATTQDPEKAALGFFLNFFGIGSSQYKEKPKSRRRRSRSRSHR